MPSWEIQEQIEAASHFDRPLKLNLGCGPIQPRGWINIDGSNRAFLATKLGWLDHVLVKLHVFSPTEFGTRTTYRNLFKGLPYQDNSVAFIYAGELWEHFEYQGALELTKECRRVLKPKGVLRVCVPDGPEFWGRYLAIYQEEFSKPQAHRNAARLVEHVESFFKEICTRRVYLGSMGHKHKWQFDEVQLIDMFEQSGFTNVAE